MPKARTHPAPQAVHVSYDHDSGLTLVQYGVGVRAFDLNRDEQVSAFVRYLKELSPTRKDAATIAAAAKGFPHRTTLADPRPGPVAVARYLNPMAAKGVRKPSAKTLSIEALIAGFEAGTMKAPSSEGETTH